MSKLVHFSQTDKGNAAMTFRTTAIITALSTLLMGCADTGYYPLSGQEIGATDQVQFMSPPNVTRY